MASAMGQGLENKLWQMANAKADQVILAGQS
jgi:hypothetical protein